MTSTALRPHLDVCVVMPAKDRAGLIGRALASIETQTVVPRAVVVVDDGSTDDTAGVARRAGATVIELGVSGGSGPARNVGIENASTTWIAFLDSDDAWEPDHLERLAARAEGHVLVCAPGRRGTDLLGNASGREVLLSPIDLLAPGSLVCTSGTMVRRETLVEAGLFRSLRRAQDLDMWLRVVELGPGIALATPSFRYFLHEGQAINDRELMRECYAQIVRDCETRPWFRPGDSDRAFLRFVWDDLRSAERAGGLRSTTGPASWIARRPHTWSVLARMLRQRRLTRTALRSEAPRSTPRWRATPPHPHPHSSEDAP